MDMGTVLRVYGSAWVGGLWVWVGMGTDFTTRAHL